MKTNRYILALAIWLLGFSLYSRNMVNPNSKKLLKTANIELVSSNKEASVVKFSFDGFSMKQVQTPNGTENVITVGNGTPLLIKGAPDMQKLTASLIIPDKGAMKTEVVSSNYTEYANVHIAPSKGNLTRNIDPATIPFTYGQAYSDDAFYPGKLAEMSAPYILRDYRGEAVWVYPFQYNPVTKVLRVYSEITVKVSEKGTSGTNELIRTKSLTKTDDEFLKIYGYHFLNYKSSKYTPLEEQGNMLVICYDAFMSAMQPFVDWKNTIGRHTEMVSVTTAGGTDAAIKTYVENYYNTNGLTYLLLVGDAAQIPPYNATAGPSDNSYGYILGGDSYPEVFVGRFSAENIPEVQTQVQRTITYELNPSTSSNWLNKGVGIGSAMGPGDDNEYDYEHIRNIRTKLMNYQYSVIDELYDGNQGGQDLAGDPDPSMLAADVNAGTGIITYCGHGASTEFVTTGFSNSDVDNLTNNNMWPFIWSVACVNGEFTNGTCFAESWLRATHNGQPSGAIATLMSTINQSWNPPMEGEDEMVDLLVESYSNNIKRTFGGLSMNGCMKMNDTYGSSGTEMTDTWTIFGDPSVMVRTDTPKVMTVTHPSVINVGATQMTVNCNVEGALIALTINKQIIGTGIISGGSAAINFVALTAVDTIKVAATAYNHIPYLGDVQIIVPSGPWVMYFSNTIDDALGNNNGLPDNNETINLNVILKNSGVAVANGVSATCSTTDPYISMIDTTQVWGNIAASTSSSQNGAYKFKIADSVPDQHVVLFTIKIKDSGINNWINNFNIVMNAPVLTIGDMTIDDASGGNGNGQLDLGETANIVIPITNTGHANALNTQSVLTSGSSYMTLNSDTSTLNTINVGANTNATFNISVNAATPIGSIVDFTNNVTYFDYSAQRVFYKKAGLVDEDWETGTFTKFQWVQVGNAPWIISNVGPYEGIYCAKSGTITDSQTSELMISFNVLANDSISFYKKVSSEDGYDYLKFYIDAGEQGEWCGEVPWSRNVYPVTTGNHTFKWVYEKDFMVSAGSDCAWIDYILLPPILLPTSINESSVNGILFNFYPNPSNDKGIINYSLIEDSNVSLAIYNSVGQQVIDLVNKYQTKGSYSVIADLSWLRVGVYYCKLIVSGGSITQKIILTR